MMAQPIRCDPHQGEHFADMMVTRLETGDVIGMCMPSFIQFCESVISDASAQDRDDETAMLSRIADVVPPSGASLAGDDENADSVSEDAEQLETPFPATTKVVKRGRSRSRAKFEAHKRDREAPAATSADMESPEVESDDDDDIDLLPDSDFDH